MEEKTVNCNGTCEVCTCKSHTQSCHTELGKVSPTKQANLLNAVQATLFTNYYSLITQT